MIILMNHQGRRHWQAFALKVKEKITLAKDSLVVDIGSHVFKVPYFVNLLSHNEYDRS